MMFGKHQRPLRSPGMGDLRWPGRNNTAHVFKEVSLSTLGKVRYERRQIHEVSFDVKN